MDTDEAYPMVNEESSFDEDSDDEVVDEVITHAVFQKDLEFIDLLIKKHADEYLPKKERIPYLTWKDKGDDWVLSVLSSQNPR